MKMKKNNINVFNSKKYDEDERRSSFDRFKRLYDLFG